MALITKFSQWYRREIEEMAFKAFAFQQYSTKLTEDMMDDEHNWSVGGGKTIESFVYEDGEMRVNVSKENGVWIESWIIESYNTVTDSVIVRKIQE